MYDLGTADSVSYQLARLYATATTLLFPSYALHTRHRGIDHARGNPDAPSFARDTYHSRYLPALGSTRWALGEKIPCYHIW